MRLHAPCLPILCLKNTLYYVLLERFCFFFDFRLFHCRSRSRCAGSVLVFISLPFAFSPPILPQVESSQLNTALYYCFFIVFFQIGWASIENSHMALASDLTPIRDERTALLSVRYDDIFFRFLSIPPRNTYIIFFFCEIGNTIMTHTDIVSLFSRTSWYTWLRGSCSGATMRTKHSSVLRSEKNSK